ncbi:potassium channel family protein [uncultured Tateyamaria sp.]|uniref:potassium channel family protein n=1 Tax=uncultured Tateyamaria sp. TaxID=455651 RepID=UPI002632CC32|nr:potassium channel family protein [uncultured Tateyamaria sp.]
MTGTELSDLQQILLGTGLLTLSAIIHVTAVALSVPLFGRLAERLPEEEWPRFRIVAFLAFAVFVLVFAHTLQVWTWAACFLAITELPDLSTSFYFATVTYTTLGYGDIVLGPDARIVATFCAITGLLTFGISTAFLIGVLARILPNVFSKDPKA